MRLGQWRENGTSNANERQTITCKVRSNAFSQPSPSRAASASFPELCVTRMTKSAAAGSRMRIRRAASCAPAQRLQHSGAATGRSSRRMQGYGDEESL